MQVTVEMALAKQPMGYWTPKLVAKLWKGRAALTLHEVADLKEDGRARLSLILDYFLDDRRRRLLACDLAEQAMTTAGDADPLCLEAIRVARAFANGEASEDRVREVNVAVRATAAAVTLDYVSTVRVARLCAANACSLARGLPELRPYNTDNVGAGQLVMGNLHNLEIVTRWTYPWGEFPGKVPGAPTAESVRKAAVQQAVAYAEEA
jgi:hypothetical protein